MHNNVCSKITKASYYNFSNIAKNAYKIRSLAESHKQKKDCWERRTSLEVIIANEFKWKINIEELACFFSGWIVCYVVGICRITLCRGVEEKCTRACKSSFRNIVKIRRHFRRARWVEERERERARDEATEKRGSKAENNVKTTGSDSQSEKREENKENVLQFLVKLLTHSC